MAGNFKRALIDGAGGGPRFQRGILARLQQFFTQDIWSLDGARLPVLRRFVRRVSRLSFLTINGFVGDACMVRASALTYVTVLSIVPLLAFSFAMLKGLGIYSRFHDEHLVAWLDRFLPLDPASGEVGGLRTAVERVFDFVDRTNVGGLGSVGLVILLLAVLRLLGTIEGSFNAIWGVRRARNLVRKLTDYLAIVIVTPLFLVLAIGWSSAAKSHAFVQFLDQNVGLNAVVALAVRFGLLFAGWFAFTFVYMALPNTRTRFSSAALGGFVAGAAWQVLLWLHVDFQIGVAKYNAIYSTFAAFPIFLVWVQLSWVIVLFGAELAFAHQHESDYRRVAGWKGATPALKAEVALRVLGRVVRAFLDGAPPLNADEMARNLAIPPEPVDEVLGVMQGLGLVAPVEQGLHDAWLVARDPASIRVAEVLEALEGSFDPRALAAPTALDSTCERLLAGLSAERRGSVYNLTLREMVERASAREREAGAGAAEWTQPDLAHP